MKLDFVSNWRQMEAALLAAGISAAASALSTGGQIYAAGKMNRKTRQWNEKMYGRQRADALADWNMQNEYNSPKEQMARLKAAGLNPNLVYGNGVDTTSGPVRSSDAPSWHPQAPDLSGFARGASDAVSTYYDAKIKQQTVENLKSSNAVMEADKALKEAQAIATTASANMSQFDLGQKQTLASTVVEAARANLNNILASTANTQQNTEATKQKMGLDLQANERAAIKQGMDLKEAAQRILNMRLEAAKNPLQQEQIRAQIRSLDQDTRIKKLTENLKSMGIESTDNFFLRMLAQILGGMPGAKGLMEKLK